MSMDRWKKIKWYFKLNNNIISKPRGQSGYDPCSKYDFILQCFVCNMNYLTMVADGDGTVDETSWGFGGHGTEAVYRILGKRMNKGGQTTLLYDINRRYPRGYIHCHKLQSRPQGLLHRGPQRCLLSSNQSTSSCSPASQLNGSNLCCQTQVDKARGSLH